VLWGGGGGGVKSSEIEGEVNRENGVHVCGGERGFGLSDTELLALHPPPSSHAPLTHYYRSIMHRQVGW